MSDRNAEIEGQESDGVAGRVSDATFSNLAAAAYKFGSLRGIRILLGQNSCACEGMI